MSHRLIITITCMQLAGVMGCATTEYSANLSARSAKVANLNLGSTATLPIVADIVVESSKRSVTIKSTKRYETIESLKQQALVKLAEKHKADLIVEPTYTVDVESGFNKYLAEVRVTGWPAQYKNLRQANVNELEARAKFGGNNAVQVVGVSQDVAARTTSGSVGAIVLTAMGAFVLLVLVASF